MRGWSREGALRWVLASHKPLRMDAVSAQSRLFPSSSSGGDVQLPFSSTSGSSDAGRGIKISVIVIVNRRFSVDCNFAAARTGRFRVAAGSRRNAQSAHRSPPRPNRSLLPKVSEALAADFQQTEMARKMGSLQYCSHSHECRAILKLGSASKPSKYHDGE